MGRRPAPGVQGYTPRSREPPWEPVAVAASGSEQGQQSTPLSHGPRATAGVASKGGRGRNQVTLLPSPTDWVWLGLAQIYSWVESEGFICALTGQSEGSLDRMSSLSWWLF